MDSDDHRKTWCSVRDPSESVSARSSSEKRFDHSKYSYSSRCCCAPLDPAAAAAGCLSSYRVLHRGRLGSLP